MLHFIWACQLGCSEYKKISKFWYSQAFLGQKKCPEKKLENGFFLKIYVAILAILLLCINPTRGSLWNASWMAVHIRKYTSTKQPKPDIVAE